MTENPPENEDLRPSDEKLPEEEENGDPNGTWSEDQKRRSYYYDDAHGYEVYDPDEPEEDEKGRRGDEEKGR